MIFATHNSGTGEKLVWWQRPFGALLNATSRCQDMTIKEQLEFGVRFFNLQITMYKGEWVFSHGICVYTGKLLDAISLMNKYAKKESPIYYQLYLDKNFLLGQKKDEFRLLVNELALKSAKSNVKLHSALIEGTKEYPYSNDIKLDCYESYWSKSWAKYNAKSWIDKLPLPKRWAKLHNQEAYDKGMKHQFFMGDFVNRYINYVEEKPTTDLTVKPTNNKPTTTPTSTPTPSIVPNGIKCILNVIGTGIITIKNKEFYFVFNNISTYTVHIKAKSGYKLPTKIEANGCDVKSWNPITGKLVIYNIAQDGEFAYFPSVMINAILNTTVTPTPTVTPTSSCTVTVTPTVSSTPTVTPTSSCTVTVTPTVSSTPTVTPTITVISTPT